MTQTHDPTPLIKRAQRGDRAAFEALLQAHYDVIYRIAYKWCGNQADAEDVSQEACVKLARALDSFDFRSAFLTWLYTLVINTAKDWLRSRHREPVGLDAAPEPVQPPTGEQRTYAGEVLAYLRTLPEKEQEAIHLVFGEGLTHRQAAVVMDCKESTVSWYIHEARKKLNAFENAERCYG